LWANFRALIGIFSQSVGPSLAIWANPVQFSSRRHGGSPNLSAATRALPNVEYSAPPRDQAEVRVQCSDLAPIFMGMHRNAPLSPMEEGARVHRSYGSYAP
jgi:hypothetical protein